MAFADLNFNFAGSLLSSVKTGVPVNLTASLSASNGSVAIAVLSGFKGLAFPSVTVTSATSGRVTATLAGSTFVIATAYHNQYFGLIPLEGRALTIFQYNSASTAQTSVSGVTTNATYPELRRLSVLGYV